MMNKTKLILLRSQGGIGLVEVLIATAIMAIIGLGLVNMTVDNTKAVRSLSQSQDVQSFVNGIELAIGNNLTCATTLGSPNVAAAWTTIPLTKLVLGGAVLADTTQPMKNLTVNSIGLINLSGAGYPIVVNTTPTTTATFVNMTRYLAEMDVAYARKGDSSGISVGGNGMQTRKFYLSMAVDSTGKIFNCYGGQTRDFFQEMCERQLGGTYDESKNPSCLLSRVGVADSFTNQATLLGSLNTDVIAGSSTPTGIGLTTNGLLQITKTGAITFGDVGGWPSTNSAPAQRSYIGQCTNISCNYGNDVGTTHTTLTGTSNPKFPIVFNNAAQNARNRVVTLADHVVLPAPQAMLGVGLSTKPKAPLDVMNFHGGPSDTAYGGLFESNGQANIGLFGPSEDTGSGGSYSVIYFGKTDMLSGGASWTIAHRKAPWPNSFVLEYRNGMNAGDFLILDPVANNTHVTQNFLVDHDSQFSGKVNINGHLTVAGTINATGTITSASDRNLKRDIRPLENVLEKALSLESVRYRWKDYLAMPGEHMGFIAQDLEKKFPELVATGTDGKKSIAYMEFSAVLLKSLQELSDRQKSQNESCDSSVAEMKAEMQRIRAELSEMKSMLSSYRE